MYHCNGQHLHHHQQVNAITFYVLIYHRCTCFVLNSLLSSSTGATCGFIFCSGQSSACNFCEDVCDWLSSLARAILPTLAEEMVLLKLKTDSEHQTHIHTNYHKIFWGYENPDISIINKTINLSKFKQVYKPWHLGCCYFESLNLCDQQGFDWLCSGTGHNISQGASWEQTQQQRHHLNRDLRIINSI